MWIFRIKSSLKQNINLGKKEFVKTIMIPLIFLDTQISSYFIENLHQQRKESIQAGDHHQSNIKLHN